MSEPNQSPGRGTAPGDEVSETPRAPAPGGAGADDPDDPWGWLYRGDSGPGAESAPPSAADAPMAPAPTWDHDGSGSTDGPGWDLPLYRDEAPDGPLPPLGTAPGGVTAPLYRDQPLDEPIVRPGTGFHDASSPGSGTGTLTSGVRGTSFIVPPPVVHAPAGEDDHRRRGVLLLGLLGAVVVLVVAIVVLVAFLNPLLTREQGAGSQAPVASAAPVQVGSAIKIAKAQASCVAPDGVDTSGKPVPYGAANLIDDKPSTAWRCDGDGVGTTITLGLPAGSSVAAVGIVNGYTKTVGDDTDYYPQYRRVTRVQWAFPDGTKIEQDLADGDEELQVLNIQPQNDVSSVTVTVLASTAPGRSDPTRDAVLVSEAKLFRVG